MDAQVASGTRAFVIDSVDDDDVTRVAELVDHWSVTTGGDALPGFLARQWLPARSPARGPDRAARGARIRSGHCR